jgi:hypothetical protein
VEASAPPLVQLFGAVVEPLGLIGAELATRGVPFADAVEAALTANLSRPDAQNLPLGLPDDQLLIRPTLSGRSYQQLVDN